MPRIEVSFYRGDEPDSPYPHNIGQTDFEVRICFDESGTNDPNWDLAPDIMGFLTADEARGFIQWLAGMIQEIDPHQRNGEPIEWHTVEGHAGAGL